MPELFDFQKLNNLIAVVEAGNITRAANVLYMTQPALSTQIKALEEAHGVPLLIRHRTGVRPTPAAEILIAGGRELFRMSEKLIDSARALHSVANPPIRLGFSSFVDHALFEMVCLIGKSHFPECQIAPKGGSNVELLISLESGEIDAALLTLPVNGVGFETHQFTQSRLVVCMRADDPLAKLKEIAPSQLQAKLTIFQEPRQHPEAHLCLMEMLEDICIKTVVASTSSTPQNIQWMVESVGGYALVREGSELQKGLVTRPVAGVSWTVDSALILSKAPSHRAIPCLLREMRKRVRMQRFTPSHRPPRRVLPLNARTILPKLA
jgi:DNA-binding transcriptional LysR family regulator